MLFCVAGLNAFAGSTEPFSAGDDDSRTIHVQRKVEELFDRGDYQRAFFIYKNELAPLGDKYAQYMVGYMYLTGTGVDEDPAIASAWYRLAAERANPELLAVRDQLIAKLNRAQQLESDQTYRQLRQRYADVVVLARLIRADLRRLSHAAGAAVLVGGGQNMIVDPRAGARSLGEGAQRRLRARVDERLAIVARALGLDGNAWSVDSVDIDELERYVSEAVADIDER